MDLPSPPELGSLKDQPTYKKVAKTLKCLYFEIGLLLGEGLNSPSPIIATLKEISLDTSMHIDNVFSIKDKVCFLGAKMWKDSIR